MYKHFDYGFGWGFDLSCFWGAASATNAVQIKVVMLFVFAFERCWFCSIFRFRMLWLCVLISHTKWRGEGGRLD
jgi:hypothetical protein